MDSQLPGHPETADAPRAGLVVHDWITRFVQSTEGITSPELFRLWAGITAIAGALERRVWVETSQSPVYPNLFVLLVAPPGVGKTQAISRTEALWHETKAFKIAPSNVTKAALIDALTASGKTHLVGQNLIEYHSMLVAASELGVMVPSHDAEFLSVLNYIYDNPPSYSEERRTNNLKIDIVHPQMTIIAGTQPAWLSSVLPEEAWGMGFTSRFIMIYGGEKPKVDLFNKTIQHPAARQGLVKDLESYSQLMGQFRWEYDAQELLSNWHNAGEPPVPTNHRLEHYNTRRILHVIKLAMVSAVSRSGQLIINIHDVERAREWLIDAELVMPDIFRAMVQKSDTIVIKDYHAFAMAKYAQHSKPINAELCIAFLSTRVPSERIKHIMATADQMGAVVRNAGTDFYIPKALNRSEGSD